MTVAAQHAHDHSAVEAPYVDEGPTDGPPDALVLDIGGDIGALILYAEEGCLGQEIDLTPVGAPRSHHMHTMIRRRRGVGREFIAGVYPELCEGLYTVWGLDDHPLGDLHCGRDFICHSPAQQLRLRSHQ